MATQVVAIRKSGGAQSTHEHITRIRAVADGTTLVFEQAIGEVIAAIERGVQYYVSRNGRTIPLSIGSRNGVKHIKTLPDDTLVDNLLSLPLF